MNPSLSEWDVRTLIQNELKKDFGLEKKVEAVERSTEHAGCGLAALFFAGLVVLCIVVRAWAASVASLEERVKALEAAQRAGQPAAAKEGP